MPSASATQKLKEEKGSRASSVSKDPESPSSDLQESSYLKELQKTLRNAVKKLNSFAKVDAIIAENPNKSLDELIEEKKINNDQKAQVLKKPTIQATIAQAEEQIGHYKQFAAQYEDRLVAQKAELVKAHEAELEAVRNNAIADATEASKKALHQQFYTVTKFLCAAAILRRDGDAVTTESRAFEGVLFEVYAGNQSAVNSLLKIAEGADEKVNAVEGTTLDFTYGDVKQASDKFAPPEETTEVASEATPTTDPTTDPTVANAGLTELQDTSFGTQAEPAASQVDQLAPPAQTLVSDAGNSIAEQTWAPTSDESSEWVKLPRNPDETDTGLQATPASADAGLNNGSVGADISTQGENGAKAGGRRRHGQRGGRGRNDAKRAGEGRGGEGRGEGRAGEGRAGEGRAGEGRGGEGRAGEGRAGEGRVGEGRGRGGRRGGRGGRGRGSASGPASGSAEAPASSE
ncbi:Histone-fold [Penicillium expansum]|nr:Histone-fold [Penicillium expansum]